MTTTVTYPTPPFAPLSDWHESGENAASTVVGRAVHLIDVTIAYDRGNTAFVPVSSFNLYAPNGSITALVGRSGSGKTSILSSIAGMLRPHSGSVWLGGIDVTSLRGRGLDTYRREHVGVVHQNYNLIASLTAVENVSVPLTLLGGRRRQSHLRATSLLNSLGLNDELRKRPAQLSGGQQQRVAVARALATNPSVILADEPTAHLDSSSVADVLGLLRTISDSGRTVIVATHDDRLLCHADHVVPLSR
jgi:putative ABC transport system ATP-binding protein